MNRSHNSVMTCAGAATALLGVIFASAAVSQDAPRAGAGPEHERLKPFAGTWKTKAEFFIPGQKDPMVSTGTETAKMTCADTWVVFDYAGDDKKENFTGHGQMGWDSVKKKYVGTWVDSLSPNLQYSEGSVDATGKIFTLEGDVAIPGMEPFRQKNVSEIKDANTKTYTMYRTGKDGKEFLFGRITYTRRR